MRKESLLGLGFLAISFILPRILDVFSQILKYDKNLNKTSFPNFIVGAMTGLGLCLLVIGLLPSGAYNVLNNLKNSIKNIFV